MPAGQVIFDQKMCNPCIKLNKANFVLGLSFNPQLLTYPDKTGVD